MPPIAYSGALQPKKKSELQEIAVALRLSDQGTKDEIQARIKRHLDANQDALEDDPAFTGLFGRRKRSVQPVTQPAPAVPSGRFAPDPVKPSSARRSGVIALEPIKEATPVKDRDMRDVSMFLKNPPPFSPGEVSTPAQSPHAQEVLDVTTPSSLPPLPPSPAKSLIEHLPEVQAVVAQLKQQNVVQNGNDLVISLRAFLSNSQNIWSLTSTLELLYILSATIPWKSLQIPITPKGLAGAHFSINYPPLSTFQTGAFWQVLLQWAIPTLLLPTLLGCLISFNPSFAARKPTTATSSTQDTPNAPSAPIAPLDPLTAAIIRLAAQTGYPYASLSTYFDIVGLDVLGSQWRVLSASVGLAFAFAEAINGAPQAVVNTLQREEKQQRETRLLLEERERTPVRMALMPAGAADDED